MLIPYKNEPWNKKYVFPKKREHKGVDRLRTKFGNGLEEKMKSNECV